MDKTKIEVICGFLESGKTTLMQHILEKNLLIQYDKIVVLQCEAGTEELNAVPLKNKNIVQADIENEFQIRTQLFSKIKRELNPDLILIEYNGTWPIETLLRVRLPKNYDIDKILFCADATTFELYMNNTGEMMAEQLSNADLVLFNRCMEKSHDVLKQGVKNINRESKLSFDEIAADYYLDDLLEKELPSGKQPRRWKFGAVLLFAFFFLFFLFIKTQNNTAAYTFVQSVNTVLIGVLLQAVPFLLIGVFVSSMLQVLVPDERLVRLFTNHPVLGLPLAIVMGVMFPICDCGMVPITSRLIKKGVPLPQAITFMLASPAVNPITFLSTLYAFPSQRQYAVYRVLFGIIISLIVGLILKVCKVNADEVLIQGSSGTACSSGYMGGLKFTGGLGTVEAIFRHAGMELINIGRFIVCGALISAILQIALPTSVFHSKGTNIVLLLLIMLLASFVMSVCSSSNAFIARSFANFFPVPAIMGFMVMGPMLDLSNLFVLSSSFNKKFIIKLAATLFTVGFAVFILFSIYIGT